MHFHKHSLALSVSFDEDEYLGQDCLNQHKSCLCLCVYLQFHCS